MEFERLPESVAALYAELLDQCVAAEAEQTFGLGGGTFVAKVVKGTTYWYVQRREGDHKRQIYLAPESAGLLRWMQSVHQEKARTAPDDRRRRRLVAMIQEGGAARELPATARILETFSGAGVFRLGGVVVGTQAFTAYANLFGIRFDSAHARTFDVDIAHPVIPLAVAEESAERDLLRLLKNDEARFFAVPGSGNEPSTSFKVRGRDLRVDFLTPAQGASRKPVPVAGFGVAALPLPNLDYVMERAANAVVLHGSGVLARVPRPARFALHKLWVASQRPSSERTKGRKDIAQADAVLSVLASDAPHEIDEALDAARQRRGMITAIRSAARDLPLEVRRALKS